MAWDSEAAERSEKLAQEEATKLLAGMTPGELEGVRKFANWWRKWYNGNGTNHATGHKALARWFIQNVK
jgi:hypothetical protein